MRTKIYKNYNEFLNRENVEDNGVSAAFAKNNPNFETDNQMNKGCWNCRSCSYCSSCRSCSYCSDCRSCRSCSYCSDCRYCSDCSYCSYCSSCRSCSYCSDCRSCSYCSDCRYCSDCSYCSDCRYCSSCRSCSDCRYCSSCREKNGKEGAEPAFVVPVVENLHQKVFEAAREEGCLNMSKVHCETAHCWAGHIVNAAGKAGYELEQKTSWIFAAMQINKASSPLLISPMRFFETNQEALENMKQLAEKERAV